MVLDKRFFNLIFSFCFQCKDTTISSHDKHFNTNLAQTATFSINFIRPETLSIKNTMCILQNGPEQKLSKTTITTKKITNTSFVSNTFSHLVFFLFSQTYCR